MCRFFLVGTILMASTPAFAWNIGSQLDNEGCHERITATALRVARERFATSPVVTPTADERALIDALQFAPPEDLAGDLAAMSLLVAVRDNDLKGSNPLDTIDLVAVHGDPATQLEHCIRGPNDDGAEGNETALVGCRAFIRERVLESVAGLAADGTVDATVRMPLAVYISFAGHVDPELPVFYVKVGQAIHALEDSFTHTYRDEAGMEITVVTNWIDNLNDVADDPVRDGPIHLAALDDCDSTDPLVQRNRWLATDAAIELLSIALDPSLTIDAKGAAVDALTMRYLSYKPGCALENNWCDAPEPNVVGGGCSTSGGGNGAVVLVVACAALLALRRRATVIAACVVVAGAAIPAYADPVAAADPPAVPVVPQTADDADAARTGSEPDRDVKTPTVTEVQSIREDKRLGSTFGFAAMIGGSVDHAAGTIVVAGRYRVTEKWIVGLDAEWNPWITSVPAAVKPGVVSAYATVIRRFPMKFDRINLRTSLHLGTSMLLFDVYGAPKHEIGLFGALTPLGIDYDLGKSVRIVIDPVEIALPMPHIGAIPLYYEQFRLMIGLQIGA